MNTIRKSFQTTLQETTHGMVSGMQAANAVQTPELKLPNMSQLVKKVKAVSTVSLLSVLITIFALVPNILLAFNPMAGAYGTAGSLVLLLALGLRYNKVRKLSLSAAILPLTLIVMAIFPYNPSAFYRTWVAYDIMFLLAIMYTYVFREKLAKKYQLKRKQLFQVLPQMIVIGEVLGVAGYGLLRNHYAFKGTSLLLVTPMVVMFAVTEELLFRGLIQRQIMKQTGRILAIVLVVALYAVMTVTTGNLLPIVFAVVSGGVLSVIYSIKQNLVVTSTVNIAMKLTYIGLIAGFVVR